MKRIRVLQVLAALVVTVTGMIAPAEAAAAPQITDIGTLGGPSAIARDINESGQIAGESQIANGDVHAFLLSPWVGTLVDLGTLGGTLSRANAIANRGLVVGESSLANGEGRAFTWEHGVMRALPPLAGAISNAALDVNDSGVVVGRSGEVAVRWVNGAVQSLGTLGGLSSVANGINSSGVIVGTFSTGGTTHGFVFQNGVATDLGTFGGVNSTADGINSSGDIVGSFQPSPTMPQHGYRLRNGVFTDLGALPIASRASAISNSGLIVGERTGSGFLVGVLWDYNLTPVDLSTLPGGSVSGALSVNSSGTIVGFATNAAGRSRAVLWR